MYVIIKTSTSFIKQTIFSTVFFRYLIDKCTEDESIIIGYLPNPPKYIIRNGSKSFEIKWVILFASSLLYIHL